MAFRMWNKPTKTPFWVEQSGNVPGPFGIEVGDSIGMLGMRRTGKTTLATELYRRTMNADKNAVGYVIDSNRGGDFTGWSGAYFGQDVPIIGPGPKGRQVIWQPEYDSFEMYEDFFGRLFDSQQHQDFQTIVLIDELSALRGGDSHPEFARILKRGRRRANFPGITLIYLTQELAQKAKVPRQAFSQIVHFFKFTVQHPYDLAEANRMMNLPIRVQPEHEHGFWHRPMEKPGVHAKYYRGMEVALFR